MEMPFSLTKAVQFHYFYFLHTCTPWKPLKLDDQDVEEWPQGKLFCGGLRIFANSTRPVNEKEMVNINNNESLK